jgi:hypothetical protein
MKVLFTFVLILFTFNNLFSQSYSYSYVDPCTKKVKSLTIPSGQNTITVNYYGTVSQFSGNDFNNGVFSAWINSVAAANSSQPCGEVVAQLTGNVNMIVTQNIVSTVMNVTSIANMAQSMSAMSSMSNGLGNSVNNSESGSSGGSDGSKKDKNNGKNGGGNNSNGSSSNNSGNSSGNTNTTTGNQTQGQGSQIGSNNGTSSQSTGSNGNTSGNGSTANGNGNNAGSSNGNGQANPSGSGQASGGSVNSGSGNSANPSSSGGNSSGSSNTSSSGSNTTSGSNESGSTQSNTTQGSNTSTGGSTNTSGGSTGGNSGGTGSTGSGSTSTGGTGTGGTGTGTNGTQTTPGAQDNTNTAKSGGGSTGGISNSVSNSEDNSGSGGGNGGNKNGGSRTRTGSLIGSGDVVALKSAEDPGANNQFKFTASLTHANTKNTKVSGLLGNYTTEIRNLNLTLYKAWVIPESQWTIIAANSSMLNFERDFFNTTTALASKRFKGNWKKLTVMSGLNYTWGNLGETKFSNISAVGGGFYSYNIGKKVSGSILCLAVYSPFTQFFEGQWWQSGTLLVPFNSWDYSITKTFKFNISISGVYELNRNFLNYQVLTGGKILL